jgi:stage III sporulation protein AF
MDYITAWITEIILLILLAVVLELLLPNSNLRQYVRMVVGLLLLLALLNPVLSLFNIDIEKVFYESQTSTTITDETIKKSIKNKKSEIQASQRAYIEEQIAVQMKNDVKGEIDERYNMVVAEVTVALSNEQKDKAPANIAGVYVRLAENNKNDEQQSQLVEPVDPVTINTSEQSNDKSSEQQNQKADRGKYPEILSFFAAQWDLPEDKITLDVEGGDAISDG